MNSNTAASTADAHDAPHGEHHDPIANKIGMWLFLFTEVLLFGSMCIAFAVYLNIYRWDFQEASGHLDVPIGAINTAILLTSSLTMALAIAALSRANKKLAQGLLVATLLLALAFVVFKSFEWAGKFCRRDIGSRVEGRKERIQRMLGEGRASDTVS